MRFTSLEFAIFLLCLLLLYYIVKSKYRNFVLLIFSIVFYSMYGFEKLILLFLTIVFVYMICKKMGRIYSKMEREIEKEGLVGKERVQLQLLYKRKNKGWLLLGIGLIVFMLCYCKCGTYFNEFLKSVFNREDIVLHIIVPMGISYYAFSCIGYLLDVYWRKQKPESNFLDLALAVCYFPQIVQGPIARYSRLLPQLKKERRISFDGFTKGLQLMLWGYFKKLVIADRLSIFVASVFDTTTEVQSGIYAIALCLSTIQLYADFSGCMNIVHGISELLGISLDQNFRQPFFSTTISEFWRRWHITLGEWFKDYVYLPFASSRIVIKLGTLAKNAIGVRASKSVTTALTLFGVWLLTGLWHGTGMDYVVWGIYYGTLISVSTIFAPEIKKLIGFLKINTEAVTWKWFQMVRTFIIFTIGRLITVPASLSESAHIFAKLTDIRGYFLEKSALLHFGFDKTDWSIVFFGMALMFVVDWIEEKKPIREALGEQNMLFRWGVFYGLMFGIVFFGMYGPGIEIVEFVYANF